MVCETKQLRACVVKISAFSTIHRDLPEGLNCITFVPKKRDFLDFLRKVFTQRLIFYAKMEIKINCVTLFRAICSVFEVMKNFFHSRESKAKSLLMNLIFVIHLGKCYMV